jgi:glycosyltransferase involved in cell wall biosynthesis
MRHIQWPDGFPFPDDAARQAAAASLAACPDGAVILIDGLAFGALPEVAEAHAERLRLVALVHHPLAEETGAPAWLRESERAALRQARAVIVTSALTADTLCRDYDVPAGRILVAPPGTDPAPPAPRLGVPPHILSVGTVTPRKGHDVLVAALAMVADLPWRCSLVGSLDRSRETVAALRAQIASHGLTGRILLAGEVADIAACYQAADLFVLASRHEGYGMAYAEAMAHGLPVVGTRAGAVPSFVAGDLVAVDDPAALAAALRRLLSDPQARDAAAARARLRFLALPTWDATIASVAALVRRLGGGEGVAGD